MKSLISKYKQTEFEWMPEVPVHWDMKRAKTIFLEKSIKGFYDEPLLMASQKEGVVLKDMLEQKGMEAVQNFETFKLVEINDFVISLRSFEGGIELAYNRGIISPVYTVFSFRNPEQYSVDYYKYLFKTKVFIQELNVYKTGIRDGQSISFSKFANIFLPKPALEEQKKITGYLDVEIEKINQFIQKKQHLIELLKEQRQSIINEVVREKKGWISQRLKYFSEIKFSNVDKHTIEDEIPVRLCNYVDVYKNDYIVNDFNFMDATASENEIERFKIFKDDVIITKDSEEANDIGVPAFVKENLENVVCGYHLALIRPQETKILSEFLFRKFQSKESNAYFAVRATGVTRVGLSMSDITGICISYPKSLIEQQQIVNYIKTETATIDIAIAKAEKEIELIKEYKEAMITEAVTGKLQIKNKNSQPVTQKREANWEFKEAVLISVLTDKFGSTQYPLGRKRYTKFSYLFHRHTDNRTEGYLHKAAGPYNPKTKYAGPEKIALQNRYVEGRVNGNNSGFVASSEIQNAKNYFEKYWNTEALNWMEQFRYKKNDDLELYTTVDKAMVELAENKRGINLQTVKQVIDEHPEWKPKLERDIFSDTNIATAMEFLKQLFV